MKIAMSGYGNEMCDHFRALTAECAACEARYELEAVHQANAFMASLRYSEFLIVWFVLVDLGLLVVLARMLTA